MSALTKVKKYASYANQLLNDKIYYRRLRFKLKLSEETFNRLKQFDRGYRSDESCIFDNHIIKFGSPFWFLHSLNEIFVEEVYRFNSENKYPVIIDCGANIGLSLLYFKSLFKEARLVAFEPDPAVFKQLTENIKQYNFDQVELVNAAVWIEDGELSFESEGSVGGKIAADDIQQNRKVSVPSKRLKNYLDQPVDFLKIDIEGAEYEVLKDCRHSLTLVKNLFIEYHVLPGEKQHLHEILQWVDEAGFRYYIKEAWNNMSFPFTRVYNDHYQMQLNIFCYREKSSKHE